MKIEPRARLSDIDLDGFAVRRAMWLYVFVIATVALALILWRRRRPLAIVTSEEREQMKALPLLTVKWTDDDWEHWRRLMDKDLVTITDVQGDFTVSYMLTLTDAGEKALGV